MDLTRFLRNRSTSNSGASPALERIQRASGQSDDDGFEFVASSSSKHHRLDMHKARRPIADVRDRSKNLENLRKDKRGANAFEKRGVLPSDVVMEEDEEISISKPSTAKVDDKPTSDASSTRRPLRQRQPATGDDMKKKLEEYKRLKEKRKAEEAKSKKPPFKVGVYKLEKIPETFQFGANTSTVVFGAAASKSIMASKAALRHPPITTTKGKQQTSSKPASLNSKTRSELPRRGKLVAKMIPFEKEPPSEILEPTEQVETESSKVEKEEMKVAEEKSNLIGANAPSEPMEEEQQFEVAKDDSKAEEIQGSENSTKSSQNVSTPVQTSKTKDENSFGTPVQGKDESASSMATPPISLINIDNVVFKTPIGITPMSKRRRQSIRRSEAGLLLDGLRSDICRERGSSTDRKRRRLGLPPARSQVEILGLEQIIADVEKGSPIEELLKKYATPPTEDNTTENAAHQPRKLDADFDKISDDEAAISKKASSSATNVVSAETEVHDVAYFRRVLKTEMDRLESLCQIWIDKLNSSISDEMQDHVRSVVGLARLGMDRKGRFRQFEGLIDDCELKRGEKETTCDDLQGFWDMIYFQIEDLDKKFSELATLEANGWKHPEPEKKKKFVPKKKVAPAVAATAKPKAEGAAARSNIRAMIEAKRQAMMKKEEEPVKPEKVATPKTKPLSPAVLAVPQPRNDEECLETSFDGGFFQIYTPQRSSNNTPKAENLRKSVLLTASNKRVKPANRRLSEIILNTTNILRRSMNFEDEEKTASAETEQNEGDQNNKDEVEKVAAYESSKPEQTSSGKSRRRTLHKAEVIEDSSPRHTRRRTMKSSENENGVEAKNIMTEKESETKVGSKLVTSISETFSGSQRQMDEPFSITIPDIEIQEDESSSFGPKAKRVRINKNLLSPKFKTKETTPARVTRRSMAISKGDISPSTPSKKGSSLKVVNFEADEKKEDTQEVTTDTKKPKRRSSMTIEKLMQGLENIKFTPKRRKSTVTTPSRSSKRKGSEDTTEESASKKSKSSGEKRSRVRASMIPDLMSFESPLAAAAPPPPVESSSAAKRSRKSVHSLVDSSPMTPRRSTRLSTIFSTQK